MIDLGGDQPVWVPIRFSVKRMILANDAFLLAVRLDVPFCMSAPRAMYPLVLGGLG